MYQINVRERKNSSKVQYLSKSILFISSVVVQNFDKKNIRRLDHLIIGISISPEKAILVNLIF